MPEARYRTTISFSEEAWNALEKLQDENEHLTKREIVEKSVKNWREQR
jgi:hypothetical protein